MLLLITSCIRVRPEIRYVEVRDEEVRLAGYLETLEWAIRDTPFDEIVFCDNSDYEIARDRTGELLAEAASRGKSIDFFHFPGSEGSITSGKGYGEGEIIEYVYDHAPRMREASCFHKITGRLTVANLQERAINEVPENVIGFNDRMRRMDTRFYKMSMKTFRDVMKKAYTNVDDDAGAYLECVFYETFHAAKEAFAPFPGIVEYRGVSGSTGATYRMENRMTPRQRRLLCSPLMRTYAGRALMKHLPHHLYGI